MKVLIIKFSSLGDIIHSFYVLDYLHEKFKNIQIDWVVKPKYIDLVKCHPLVEETISFDANNIRKLLKKSYDVIFDLQGNLKSSLILAFSRSLHKVGFNYKSVSEWPNLLFTNFQYPVGKENITLQYLKLIQSYFNDFKLPFKKSSLRFLKTNKFTFEGLSILVAPHSRWVNKQINSDTLINFLKLLEKKFKINLIFLSQNSLENYKNVFRKSFFFTDLSFKEIIALMKKVDLVIAMDSFLLHLASFLDISTFSLFGPTNSFIYKPLGNNHTSFQGSCYKQKVFNKRCPEMRICKNPTCINSFNSKDLLAALTVSNVLLKNKSS